MNLHYSTCRMPGRPDRTICEVIFYFPLYGFGFFVKDQVSIGMWVYFGIFISIPLIYLPGTILIACSFFNHYCFVVQLEVRDGDSLGSSFIVQNCFLYPRFLVFPYEVENCFFYVCEESCWNFDSNCIV